MIRATKEQCAQIGSHSGVFLTLQAGNSKAQERFLKVCIAQQSRDKPAPCQRSHALDEFVLGSGGQLSGQVLP